MVDPQAEVIVSGVNEREVFVGPRPFERSEQNLFFGRDREISELLSLVTSNRVVLCYAPSGAGKTSLINAGLHPRLEKEGFEVLPSTRVRGLIPEGVDQSSVANIYIFNAVLSLAKETGVPAELARCTLAEFLSTVPHQTDEEDFPSPRILIFDQFEELLTSYLERWQERDGFFQQVRDALQGDALLRVLFVMREDFVARIEPFMRILKPLQQTRFRLDLLGPAGAQAAVTGPLHGTARRFKVGVVDALVEELLKVRVESTHGEATEVIGEYVEPVQLQVVCRNLWTSLPDDVQEISHEHLKAYGDVDQALREFYESCLTGAKANLRASEPNLRQWFERQLITPAGTRGIVFRDAQQTAGLANQVVEFLENRHIIRGEWRAGSRWYELTHDRLIEPIQHANEQWRAKRQANRNRMLGFSGIAVALTLMLLAATFSFRSGTAYAVPTNSTFVAAATSVYENATLAVEAQSTTAAIQSTSVAVQADASLSKSRQLAAEALLANNRNLSLLLAIEANNSLDTAEARRSLHKVLSGQSAIRGAFLRELNAEILYLKLMDRLANHRGPVVSVAFSPDGQHFVSGSSNGTVLVWDFASRQPIGFSLTTRTSSISSVAYSGDGRLVASAGLDNQISLWDSTAGNAFGIPLQGHVGLVTCIAFSPDGKLLASGGMDQQVLVWDVQSQRIVMELKDVDTIGSLAWSPDSQVLVWGSYSSNASFWRVGESDTYDTLRIENNPILSIAWSRDGQTLAFGMASEESRGEAGDVLLWDFANRTRITEPVPDNLLRIRSVALDPSGKTLAIGRDDGSIVLWDIPRQQILGYPFKAHSHRVMSVAFSPDGSYLISAGYDGTIAIWNLEAPTTVIAVSPNGNLLATSQGSMISLWDIQGDEAATLKILSAHTDNVLALAFSPDGTTLASSGKDKWIRFWNVDTGKRLGEFIVNSIVQTLQFRSDGTLMAVGGDSGRAQLTVPLTGQVVHKLIDDVGPPVLKVQFSADENAIDLIAGDGSLTTFNLQSPQPSILDTSALPSAQDGITRVAVSTDGRWAAYFRVGGTGETVILSTEGRAHGIELSSWDQSFDPTINPDDIDFVLVKATDGIQFGDPNFDKYIKQIQAIPLRGTYHYFRENQPWQEQADLFISTVKDKGFHFFVLYLESPVKSSSTQYLADAKNWLEYVDSQMSGRVLVGISTALLLQAESSGNWMMEWPLLVAQYPRQPNRNDDPVLPPGFTEWRIWNYTDDGNQAEFGTAAPGVVLDVFNGTPAEMGEWLGLNAFSILNRSTGDVIHPNLAVQVNGTNSFAFSPDSTYLAAAGDGGVFLLDAATGEEISTLNVGGRTVHSLSFMPDSIHLVIGTDDGTVLLWDLGLLKSNSDSRSIIEFACSQVQQNLTQVEWTQYFGPDIAYRATCPNAQVP